MSFIVYDKLCRPSHLAGRVPCSIRGWSSLYQIYSGRSNRVSIAIVQGEGE
ncbi:hypothetical protein NUACC26_053150 [Scytonema sp. NUACC26]